MHLWRKELVKYLLNKFQNYISVFDAVFCFIYLNFVLCLGACLDLDRLCKREDDDGNCILIPWPLIPLRFPRYDLDMSAQHGRCFVLRSKPTAQAAYLCQHQLEHVQTISGRWYGLCILVVIATSCFFLKEVAYDQWRCDVIMLVTWLV